MAFIPRGCTSCLDLIERQTAKGKIQVDCHHTFA